MCCVCVLDKLEKNPAIAMNKQSYAHYLRQLRAHFEYTSFGDQRLFGSTTYSTTTFLLPLKKLSNKPKRICSVAKYIQSLH